MTLRQYLLIMSLGTILSWGAVGLIMRTFYPTDIQSTVLIIFYISLFLALVGTFSLAGFILRIFLLKQQLLVSRHVAISFRQGILLALLLIVALILQSKSMLSWWSALLAVLALTILEFFFISTKIRK